MPYRLKRGMGRTAAQDVVCRSETFGGFFDPACWSALEVSPIAPPGAPTGSALTVPPASGEEAQATVDALLNQQLADQQALNAQGVTSSWWNQVTGGTAAIAQNAFSMASALPWILGGVGLIAFALIAGGGGSPRRYGR